MLIKKKSSYFLQCFYDSPHLSRFRVCQDARCIQYNPIAIIENLDLVISHDENRGFGLLEQEGSPVFIPHAGRLLLRFLGVHDLCGELLVLCHNVGEHVLGIQKLGINRIRREIVLAHDENLSRFISGGRRLGGVDLLEELPKDPDQTLVVLGTENLCDKPSAFG